MAEGDGEQTTLLSERALAVQVLAPTEFLHRDWTVAKLKGELGKTVQKTSPLKEAWEKGERWMFDAERVPKAKIYRWLADHHQEVKLVVLWTVGSSDNATKPFKEMVPAYLDFVGLGEKFRVSDLQIDHDDSASASAERVEALSGHLDAQASLLRVDKHDPLPWTWVYSVTGAGLFHVRVDVEQVLRQRFDARVQVNAISSKWGADPEVTSLATEGSLSAERLLIAALATDHLAIARELHGSLDDDLRRAGGREALIRELRAQLSP